MIWTKKITKLFLLAAAVSLSLHADAQNFVSRNTRVAIYSSTPLEDIRAATDKASGVIATRTREIAVQVPIKTLDFERKLMQEHFNENYMESDKYPFAKFKGIIDQPVDFSKDGVYNVTVSGVLSAHGIDKKRTISGKITVANGVIQVNTEFKVACADHNIKIPTLVFAKIAELITIKVDGKFNRIK